MFKEYNKKAEQYDLLPIEDEFELVEMLLENIDEAQVDELLIDPIGRAMFGGYVQGLASINQSIADGTLVIIDEGADYDELNDEIDEVFALEPKKRSTH